MARSARVKYLGFENGTGLIPPSSNDNGSRYTV